MNSIYKTNKIIFDYFAFTFRCVEPEDIIELLGLESVNFIDMYGLYGYKHRYYYDGVSINFGNPSFDGVLCEMSGQGCRVYETYGNSDWFGLAYQVLINDNAYMNRIDVAYDDFNGLLDLDLIKSDIRTCSWVSRARQCIITDEFDHKELIGQSVMCGNRGSNICLRIYDKARERNRTEEFEHWVRAELQIRHTHADNFLRFLLADDVNSIYGVDIDVNNRLDALYFAVLNHFFRCIDITANDDSNLWRKPCADHWIKFINSYKGNSLSLYSAPGVEYNILRLRHVAEEMYGGLIYTYIQIFGKDQLEDNVLPKSFKLNKKYQLLIESERLRRINEGVKDGC